MVNLKEYNPELNDTVYAMAYSQGYQAMCDVNTLPKIGYLAYHNNLCVAVGFLRLVEGGFAQIDTLITNPDSHGEVRNSAINDVVDALMIKAKEVGVKGVLFLTTSDAVIARADAKGFKLLTHQVFAKAL